MRQLQPDAFKALGLLSVPLDQESEVVCLAFGGNSSAYQRGWCPRSHLDWALSNGARERGVHWLRLLWEGWHPTRVFAFPQLLVCWKHFILPSQVAYRLLDPARNPAPIYFSPAWPTFMGLP